MGDMVVVWLDGIGGGWNGGPDMCGEPVTQNIDDLGFILGEMLRHVATVRPFDESRVYLSGYSCGCYMVHTLAFQASDLVAGAACMAGYLVPTLASSPRPSNFSPVPLLQIH